MGERFRKVKEGETIDYDCGCIVTIDKVDKLGVPTSNYVSYFCSEHDPTIKHDPQD